MSISLVSPGDLVQDFQWEYLMVPITEMNVLGFRVRDLASKPQDLSCGDRVRVYSSGIRVSLAFSDTAAAALALPCPWSTNW